MSDMTTYEAQLERAGWIAFTNVGVSMLPLIKQRRDMIVIERKSTDEIKKYDVVLFRRYGAQGKVEYVLHRVIKRYPDGRFWIVGDNCLSGDDVSPEEILGVMVRLNRNGKTVVPENFGYRIYVAIWCAPYRLRFVILRIHKYFYWQIRSVIKKLRGK